MEQKVKISISIGDRIYPLKVFPSQEENLRVAAENINQQLKKLEENYAVKDKQDLLAMCTLQYAVEIEQIHQREKNDTASVIESLQQLNEELDNIL